MLMMTSSPYFPVTHEVQIFNIKRNSPVSDRLQISSTWTETPRG